MLVLQCLMFLLLLLNDGDAWRRRRRRRPCSPRDCEVSEWSHWSGCSQRCGVIETQYRTRYKTRNEACGGSCYYDLRVQRNCDMICNNGGTPSYSQCSCRTGFGGRCCELDQNECHINPKHCSPGGTCVNTHGSYRCICGKGYVASKSLTACIAVRKGCQINSNYCSPGGTCVNTHGSYRCICGKGYVASKSLTACIAESNKKESVSTNHIASGIMAGIVIGCLVAAIFLVFVVTKVIICICCSSNNRVDVSG